MESFEEKPSVTTFSLATETEMDLLGNNSSHMLTPLTHTLVEEPIEYKPKIISESPEIVAPFYEFLKCSRCGATRRLTILSQEIDSMVCENCNFTGLQLSRMIDFISTVFEGKPVDSLVSNPDPTLNNVSEYVLKELLPVLECDFNEEDKKEMCSGEPQIHSKNGLTIENQKTFDQFSHLLKNKEKERTKTKERTGGEKSVFFDFKQKDSIPLMAIITSELLINIDGIFQDDALKIIFRSSKVDSSFKMAATTARVISVQHMHPDYSDPLVVRLSAGNIGSDDKKNQVATKQFDIPMSHTNKRSEIVKYSCSQLENKGFFNALFSSSKVKGFYLDIRVSLFLLDSNFSAAYDAILNSRIVAVKESNEERFGELKEDVKTVMDIVQQAKIVKEEVEILKKRCEEHLKVDKRSSFDNQGITRLFTLKNLMVVMFFGVYIDLMLAINPTLFNTFIFS